MLEYDYSKEAYSIKIYNKASDFILSWIQMRAKWYKKRYDYLIAEIEKELNIINNRIRFINIILNGQLIVQKRKKKDIEVDLVSSQFDKLDGSYDYLLGMKIYSLTTEKINELAKRQKQLQRELNAIKKKQPKDLWIEDLNILEPLLIEEGWEVKE